MLDNFLQNYLDNFIGKFLEKSEGIYEEIFEGSLGEISELIPMGVSWIKSWRNPEWRFFFNFWINSFRKSSEIL